MASPRPFQAKHIRDLLAQRGMVANDLAFRMGLTKSAVSRKLNGSRPWTLEQMEKAARVIGVPVDQAFPPEEYK